MERLPERFDVSLGSTTGRMFVGRHDASSARADLRTTSAHALRRRHSTRSTTGTLEHFVTGVCERYGRYWAEGAKLPGIKPERVFARFRIGEGLEYLYDAVAQGRGTIIALPHIGSWEWGGSFLNSLGLGMTAIAEDLEPPALFDWFKEKRE